LSLKQKILFLFIKLNAWTDSLLHNVDLTEIKQFSKSKIYFSDDTKLIGTHSFVFKT
jgi:hypothetical protein